ncbi:MAG: hypothetical protein WA418_24565 [Bradyrhizobium sp.]
MKSGLDIFTVRNVGNGFLTNSQIGGQTPGDQTYVLTNWYARTNISGDTSRKRAWDAWTHTTTVTLVIGTCPLHQLPLSDLLARREGMRVNDGLIEPGPDMGMFGLVPDTVPDTAIDDLHLALYGYPLNYHSGDTAVNTRNRLRHAARAVMRSVSRPILASIPPRQIFKTHISTSRQLDCLLEVMPTDIAPQALVWVHLEGMAIRDIR